MRGSFLMVFALVFAAPALVAAEHADHETLAHEVAEELTKEELGHGASVEHGELSLSSLLASREFQGTLVNFIVLVGLIVWVVRKKGNPA
ncbi:MAG: hypothetical protein WCE62_15095, partial [Polyangiales bacterium]